MTSIYVGEDPGKAGFISWLDAYTLEHIDSTPCPYLEGAKGDATDKAARKRLIEELKRDFVLVAWIIEAQNAGFGHGTPHGLITQGQNYGITKGMLYMAEVPVHEVTSNVWRKHSGTPTPRYPKQPQPKKPTKKSLGKKPTKKQMDDWKEADTSWRKFDKARLLRQRKEGQANVLKKVTDLYPALDLRVDPTNPRLKKLSPDKAISILLARMGPTLAPLTQAPVEAGQGILFS
jgi:hypothetical protein